MKHLLVIALSAAAVCSPLSATASVTIEFDAGKLYNADGTGYVPIGGLLQLIASPVDAVNTSGVFLPPSSTSFVTGSDILVESFAMNYNFSAGETDSVVAFNSPTDPIQVPQGDALLLRWFPTLTPADVTPGMGPGLGTTYGQYRSNAPETEGGMPWFVPADGSYSFPGGINFTTVAAGGSDPEIDGFASNIVVDVAPIPEPSTNVMFLAAVGAVSFVMLRRKRA